MFNDPAHESPVDVNCASNDASASDGREALLHRFVGVLNGIEPQIARRMRDEIASRFGGRYCSDAICGMMAELLNGHLADCQPRLVPVKIRSSE